MSGARETAGVETLWVVGVGGVDQRTLRTVSGAVKEQLPFDVRQHPDPIEAGGLADGSVEEPHDGVDLARYAALQADRDTVLAVTDIDIDHPTGDPSYGISVLDGSLATVSTARLGTPDDEQFDERLRKEAVAHSAHLSGLSNCWREHCVLTRADTIPELDSLDERPCDSCRSELDTARPADPSDETEPSTASQEGSSNAVTHELASSARFGGMLVAYGLSLLLVFVGVAGVLNLLGTSFPESDAVAFVAIVGMLFVAWLVYRRLRRGFGWVWRRLCSTASGLL